METFANMKCNFLKTSWGVVRINDVEVYCELWLSTGMMSLKVKFKIPKGMSYSYTCSTKDAPFEDGRFLSYWIPKSMYFPVHFCGATVNELVELVVRHLDLKFFEESRKWLTSEEKELAHMIAVGSIGILDVEQVLKCDVSDLPQAFHEEVNRFRNEYYDYTQNDCVLQDIMVTSLLYHLSNSLFGILQNFGRSNQRFRLIAWHSFGCAGLFVP